MFKVDSSNFFDQKAENYDSSLYPITANTWARNVAIPDWRYEGKNGAYQRGDVIAMLNSSGNPARHCGIALNDNQIMYTSPTEVKKWRFKHWAVRRYTGS